MARKTTDTSKYATERAFVYHGADDAQKRAAVERLIAETVDQDYRDYDLQMLHGPDVTAERLSAAVGQAPLASEKRLVVISQANDIPGSEQQEIAERLERVPESACVVFVTPAPEMAEGKPKRGSELHADLMKAIRKAGKAVDFPLMKDQQAVQLVRELFDQAGKAISSTAAAAVVRRSGTDSGVLKMEVAKLSSYVGDRKTVTDADVEEVTTQTAEEKIFALMDAVGSKDAAQALRLLSPLLSGGGNIQGAVLRTLTMLARHFRQIWQARVLMDAGCRVIAPGAVPEHCEAMLPEDNILKSRDWQLRKFIGQAGNFTMDELTRCFEKVASVDLALKGIEGKISDPTLAMELLLVELSTRRHGKKGTSAGGQGPG